MRLRAVDGTARAGVVNAARDLALVERWDATHLPYLFLWRMFGEGTYVAGLEPSTNAATGRRDARERGELCVLAPGQSREYSLTLAAANGADAVAALLDGLPEAAASLRAASG